MPNKTYHLVIAEGDGPVVVPDVSPGGRARVLTQTDPYPLAERLLEECSLADLTHLELIALRRIKQRVAGIARPPVPMSEVGKAVAT